MSWPLHPPGRDLVPILQKVLWAPGLVWTGAESVTPNSDLIPRKFHPLQVAILSSPSWATLAGVYQMVMKMTCACPLTTDYLGRRDF